MHGPGTVYSPSFSTAPYIPVLDEVVATLPRSLRKTWRQARNQALRLWLPTGLHFELSVGPGATFLGLGSPDWPAVSSEVAMYAVPDRITFVASTYTPEAPKFWAMAWAYCAKGSAAFFNVQRILDQTDPFYSPARTICHEFGHALGLAHGGRGIMSGGAVPNEHDLESVSAYYQDGVT